MKRTKRRRASTRGWPGSSGRFEALERRDLLAVVSIVASQDNSLFEDDQGAKSNGAGDHLFAGRTFQADGISLRRAMLMFDFEGQLPADVTIVKAELALHVTKSVSDDVNFGLHRLTTSWGEANSNAPGNEGKGATANLGDATWLHREFPTLNWAREGGDFVDEASATTAVARAGSSYVWSSDQMIGDINLWRQNPEQNFGWMLVGGEDTNGTAKRFNSRENGNEETRPTLTIEFEENVELPSVSVGDASILESDDGTSVELTVSLSAAPATDVTVNYATVGGTAEATTDYVETSGTLTFSPNGGLTQTVSVSIVGDDVHEADEALLVRLSQVTNATLADAEGLATILNDDPLPAISVADTSIVEGDVGATLLQVPVELANPSDSEVSVNFQTQTGTADGDDFVASSGQLTFAAGETSKKINIQVNGDVLVEEDETFSVTLSGPRNAVVAVGEALLTIEDDDAVVPPWQNPELPLDVTGDGEIVPRDVLLIINYINSEGSGPLPSPGPDRPPPYFDTSGDGQISPRDALLVINHINERNAAAASPAVLDAALTSLLDEDDDDSRS